MKKNIFKILMLGAAAAGLFASCDSLKPEPLHPRDLTQPERTEEYYAALREYKKTDHSVAFGWYGNWVGSGTSLEHSLRGLPDSVDFVSLWGGWKDPSPEKLEDMHYTRDTKGTRMLVCFVVSNIGDQLTPAGIDRHEFWGYTDDDLESKYAAIEKYANAICDTLDKYGYDGFDYDFEPDYGGRGDLSGDREAEKIFIETLGKRVGPKSGTGRLFVIDGQPGTILKELGVYFDYFISQAYRTSNETSLDNGLNGLINHYDGIIEAEKVTKMFIVCENFESYAAGGGVDFTDKNGNKMKSLEGMARWMPVVNGKTVRKGGVGTFHMEYEYNPGSEVNYPALRKAIQIMNPSVR